MNICISMGKGNTIRDFVVVVLIIVLLLLLLLLVVVVNSFFYYVYVIDELFLLQRLAVNAIFSPIRTCSLLTHVRVPVIINAAKIKYQVTTTSMSCHVDRVHVGIKTF